ncbi:hypothetical protein Sru01_64880 [Sphaerisporangium rufum]|uniref:Penicillin-binding protein n=1 Tax=Sphaerisporangium rufum TaxID=1381558 RepID=A0A919V1W6_9ACTN|nr:penicillin-binding protein [Sphaerisporangium rufum]GII81506.1 hypothetical protein Sru01_64880 [Sphaerisporangium rufum]
MRALLAVVGVAAVGFLAVVLFLLREPADDGTAARRAGSSAAAATTPAAGKSVLLDVQGAAIEEFSGDCTGSGYPYLCRQVVEQLRAADPGLPTRAGLQIHTTIDLRLQRAAQDAIDAHVHRDDAPVAVQAMIVPGEGAIRAMAAGRDIPDQKGFQPGTAAMPYTLAAALAAGLRYDDGFAISDSYTAAGYASFRNCAGEAVGDPTHSVFNRDKEGDRFVTLRAGTRQVVNTFFMRLTEKAGLCETVRMAERLGLRRADGAPLMEVEAFTLGIDEADPVSVANSYATLAARGRFCEPTVITEVRDGSGVLRSFPPRCREVLDPAVADAVTGILTDVLSSGESKGIGRPAAGMPGTADGSVSAWYAGYTPDLAAAVGLGDPRGVHRHPLRDITIGGRRFPAVDGEAVPGRIWRQAMTEAARDTPETAFTPPDLARFGGCRDACPN